MNHPPQKPGFVLAWIGVVTLTVFALTDLMPAPQAASIPGGPTTSASGGPDADAHGASGTNGDPAAPSFPRSTVEPPTFADSEAYDGVQADEEERAEEELVDQGKERVESPLPQTPPVTPVTGSGGSQHAPRRTPEPHLVASSPAYFFALGGRVDRPAGELEEPERVEVVDRPLGRHVRLVRLVVWLRDLETAGEQLDAVMDWLPEEASEKLRKRYRNRRSGGGQGWDLQRLRKNASRLGDGRRVELLLDLDAELTRELRARLARLLRARLGSDGI